MELRERLEEIVPLVVADNNADSNSTLESMNAWVKPLQKIAKEYGYGPNHLFECTEHWEKVCALTVGDVRVEIPEQ